MFYSNQLYEIPNVENGGLYHMGLNIDYKNTRGKYDKKFDGKFIFNDANAFQFSIKNAYLEDRINSKSHIVFGRKPLDWSMIDTHWGFGHLNNRENIDFFTPGVEGLTGITYTRKLGEKTSCSLFGSVIYIPELNPSMKINAEDGTIEAANPWSSPPNSTVDIGGVEYQMNYEVDLSGVPGTVFKPTAGLNCAYKLNKNIRFNAFAINKPEGKINTGAEVGLDSKSGKVNVSITPQAFYQTVIGATVDYQNAGMNGYIGVLSSIPEEYPDGDQVITDWLDISTEKYEEQYFGTGVTQSWRYLDVGLHYVARISEYSRSDNMLAIDPRWNQAVNFSVAYRIMNGLTAKTDFKYDAITHDRLLMVGGEYLYKRKHRISAGVNVVGSADAENDVDTVGSFWSRFRNNDAIYARYGYIF